MVRHDHYHHKDRSKEWTWVFLELGLPLIFWGFVFFYAIDFIGLSFYTTTGFFTWLALSVILSVISGIMLSKFYNKISNYLNGR